MELISQNSAGDPSDGPSHHPSISSTGRWVAFESNGNTLEGKVSWFLSQIFLRDRLTGSTVRVSESGANVRANLGAFDPDIAADGSAIAYETYSFNLIVGDTNFAADIYVVDRVTGTNERVSVDSNGNQSNGDSLDPAISADGRFVAYSSVADNLVPVDINGMADVFVHDRQTGETEMVSVNNAGLQAGGRSKTPSISGNGMRVVFSSSAPLVAADTDNRYDIYVHNRGTGATKLVSTSTGGVLANDDCFEPVISRNGRYVAFHSNANNLVLGDGNGATDIFVKDLMTGDLVRASVSGTSTEGNDDSSASAISSSGQFVTYHSYASNLINGDTNGKQDVFVRDLLGGTTQRVSESQTAGQGDGGSCAADINGDGSMVVFATGSNNFDAVNFVGLDVYQSSPTVSFSSSPGFAKAGDTVTFSAWNGVSGGRLMLFAVEVNGTPISAFMAKGVFDAAGVWQVSHVVPAHPMLSGLSVSFCGIGSWPGGRTEVTNQASVQFD